MAIAEIIKYEGDNETFVWKHPCVDFNTTTQLIVHESQEAIFFMNGKALDLFGPGRYTLATQNIPLLSKIVNIPTDGETPFHCEVYFINKTEQMTLKWGTDSKLQYIEPVYNFPIEIGASGEMSISVADSKKILVKLLGTQKLLQRTQLVSIFRSFLMTRIKSYMAKTIRISKINIFEIDEELETFSENLKLKLDKDFAKYGINLDSFLVTSIIKPNGEENYERFKQLHFRKSVEVAEAELKQKLSYIEQQTRNNIDMADAELKQKLSYMEQQTKLQQVLMESQGNAHKIIAESKGMAQKRAAEGYTYQQEHGFKVAEKIATNEITGQLTNLGIGLGTMVGIGGFVAGTLKDSMNSVNNMFANKFCNNCGEELMPGTAFCDKCGIKVIENSCLKCGFVFIKQGNYCPVCGTKREVTRNGK